MENEIQATLSILTKVIRKIPAELLRKKYEVFNKLFSEIYKKYGTSEKLRLLSNVSIL